MTRSEQKLTAARNVTREAAKEAHRRLVVAREVLAREQAAYDAAEEKRIAAQVAYDAEVAS